VVERTLCPSAHWKAIGYGEESLERTIRAQPTPGCLGFLKLLGKKFLVVAILETVSGNAKLVNKHGVAWVYKNIG